MAHPSRFGADKQWSAVRWPAAPRHAHPHDFNDLGLALEHRSRQIADTYLRDGSVIEGGEAIVDPATGAVTLAAGRVYIGGQILDVPERLDLVIATDAIVRLAVAVTEETVDHVADPELRGQIVGSRTQGEPGADRIKTTGRWICDAECQHPGATYPVYTVVNGEILTPEPPTDPLDSRLARYDREARGHYIVSGWRVAPLGYVSGAQHFAISEGTINVWGYKRTRAQSYRLIETEARNLETVEAEPHTAPADASGDVVITTAHAPIDSVNSVTVTREASTTLTRGATPHTADPLPHTSVAALIEVTQGATTYVQGVDYVRTGDAIEWRASSTAEPTPGSSYDVTYHYLDSGAPDAHDATTVTVSDVVPSSTVLISYEWALPRTDAIAVDRDGAIHYMLGEPALYSPIRPRAPSDWFVIAEVRNSWGGTPEVENIGTRAVHNARVELSLAEIRDLRDLVAQNRLEQDVNLKQAHAKRGLLVDPFRDDSLRDQGVAQTAAIVDETLQLPIDVTAIDRSLGDAPLTLDYGHEVVVRQELATSALKIQPYAVFDLLPGRAHLDPAVDLWTEFETDWASAATRTITQAGTRDGLLSSTTETELLGTETREAETLRERSVLFELDGFGVGEPLSAVTFDGVAVTPAVNPATSAPLEGDAQGRLSGVFDVPAGIPAGAKRVRFEGAGGTRAVATYIGGGTVTVTQLRQATTEVWTWDARPAEPEFDAADVNGDGGDDPLGQTFALTAARAISGVDVIFDAIGDASKRVVAQLRKVENGYITKRTLAEGEIDMTGVSVGEWVAVDFATPYPALAGVEYAIVFMSDDTAHALRIARLGEYDAIAQARVTRQPYTVGTLQTSSNNSGWTIHHDADLTFRLRAAAYTETERVIALADPVTLVGCTDLIVNVAVEEPSPAARALVRITRADESEILAAPGQLIQFAAAVSEDVEVAIVLIGAASESPVAHPSVTILAGALGATGSYVSRSLATGGAGDPYSVVVTFDAALPSGSTATVEIGEAGSRSVAPVDHSVALADGWTEFNYVLDDFEGDSASLELTLAGGPGARPRARALRMNVTRDPVNIITGT